MSYFFGGGDSEYVSDEGLDFGNVRSRFGLEHLWVNFGGGYMWGGLD